MSEECLEILRVEDILARRQLRGEEQDRWRQHLQGCAPCREQWQVGRVLSLALADEPAPRPAADFNLRLKGLAPRKRVPAPAPSGKWIWAYWVLTGTLSAWILASVPWPFAWTPQVVAGVVAVLVPLSFLTALVWVGRLPLERRLLGSSVAALASRCLFRRPKA